MAKPQSFKKGDSRINRNGAPKKEWTMAGILTDALEEQDETGVPFKILIARKLRSLGLKGDMIAIKEINNRMDGMPVQPNTHEGELKHSLIVYKPEKNKE